MTNQNNTALATTDSAVEHANAGDMSLAPTRQFSRQEITLLQNTIARGLTMPEISLFIQASRHYQLDPFSRQIYAIKRGQGDKAQLTIQISIDGFRVIAERNPEYAGQTPPEFMDRHGNWHEGVWIPEIMEGIGAKHDQPEGPFPVAARVGIKRRGWSEPVYGYAAFREYAQWTSQGLGDMWARMPGNQLAKCAESLGLRKAFPNDLSGAYSNDEMAQAAPPHVEVEGMSLDQLDKGAAANTDEYLPPGAPGTPENPLDGEVMPPRGAARPTQKSPEEQQWERENPPAQRAPAAAARPAPQRPAPAPAAPAAPAAVNPTQDIKTLSNAMKWANGTYGLSSEEQWRICGVDSNNGMKNLGVTKVVEKILKWDAERQAAAENANDATGEDDGAPPVGEVESAGAADAADQDGDIDPDELPF